MGASLLTIRRPARSVSARESSWQLDRKGGTCSENGDVAEVEALDLSSFVLDFLQDLLVYVQRGEHEQPDVELQRNAQECCEVVLVVVALVSVSTQIFTVVSN